MLVSPSLHEKRTYLHYYYDYAPSYSTIVGTDTPTRYNDSMICPNDGAEMHQVSIVSHYGQAIFLDQCEKCGGVWFDESELFRARQGEADKVESLDQEALRTPSPINYSQLICPRDRSKLFRFTDKHFPGSIILTRCPSCHGIWLNRGEFTKYQQSREETLRSTEKSDTDKKLAEHIAQLTVFDQTGHPSVVLGKLGNFLSTDMDTISPLNTDSPPKSNAAQDTVNMAVGIVLTLLRFFLRI
jgi:Zn-finger nucleic acid-binding protein